MPFKPAPDVVSISTSDLARANSMELNEAALATQVTRLGQDLAAAQDTIRNLQAQIPPPVIPIPPVGPGGNGQRLNIVGNKVFTKGGQQFINRGIEVSWDNDCQNLGADYVADLVLKLGANGMAPLFEDGHGDAWKMEAVVKACLKRNMACWVNFDHQQTEGGRQLMCTMPYVDMCNAYPNVILECEIETPEAPDALTWVKGVLSLVNATTKAGHQSILKVGASGGGRELQWSINQATARAILAAHPKQQVMFGCQMYWSKISGWYQSSLAGFATGLQGSLQALNAIASAPHCYGLGFDFHDNVGETGEFELIAEADRLGLIFNHWELTKDGNLPGNNLIDRFDWRMQLSSITQTGKTLQQLLKAKQKIISLS